ncbi:MAG: leucyl/phenylalanyl-tRNA--protein transferase, partial [Oceanidesulfovibrio sp.]
MAIYYLPKSGVGFPDPQGADPDGLLAVGGDLSPRRLAAAYAMGIFPWYHQGSPILWWSPDPRLVLEPSRLHVPKSLRRVLNKGRFRFTLDQDFQAVMRNCARAPRPQGDGTWIVEEMVQAYVTLHQAGFAHSVEVWRNDRLAGGLYGVALGRVFFGESMFFLEPDASKAA